MTHEVSPHSTATVDTKSRDKILSKRLRLALSSFPEKFFSWLVYWACHTYVPKPKLSLCILTSVLKVLGHTTSRLGPLEPHIRSVPTKYIGILPTTFSKIIQIRRTLQIPRGHPNNVGLRGQTRAVRHKVSIYLHSFHRWISPEKKIEPDRTLGHNRIHCFGFQACLVKSLDSNTSIRGFLRHPSEQISSPQGNLCMGATSKA